MDAIWLYLAMIMIMLSLMATSFVLGMIYKDKKRTDAVKKVLDNYYPHSPEPTLQGIKYRIKDAMDMEVLNHERSRYW
jgi:hypothetical protein